MPALTWTQVTAFAGALLVTAGVFLPLVRGPLGVTLTYWAGGRGDGWYHLGFAAVAVVLLGFRRVRLVALPAVASLVLMGYTYVNLARLLGAARGGGQDDLSNALGRAVLGSFRFEYGWLVLLAGVLLMLVAAAAAGRVQAERGPAG